METPLANENSTDSERDWKRRLTSHGMGRALRHRDFTLYLVAGWVSNIGVWFQRIGVQWLAWSLTGSYAWLGAIALADAISIIILLPIFGTLTDRKDRLVLARQAQFFLMLVGLLLAVLTFAGLVDIWVLFVIWILHGIAESFWTPIRMAMAPNLVPREDLAAAIGAGAVTFNIAQFIGPALAGLIIVAFDRVETGVGVLFTLNVVSFAGYFVVLFMIRLHNQEVDRGPRGNILSDFRDGLVYVANKAGLGVFAILILGSMLFTRSYRELLAGLADGVFSEGATGLAILTAANAFGGLVASVMVANLGPVKGLIRVIFISLGLAILFNYLLAWTGMFWIAVASVAFIAGAGAYGSITGQYVIQSSIHGEMRGRVMSIWSMILRGGPATGAFFIGVLEPALGFNLALAIMTTLFLVIWLGVLPRLGHLAAALEKPPDGVPGGGR